MREVTLTQGQVALVDDEDYDRVVGFGDWFCGMKRANRDVFYAITNLCPGKQLTMHRFIRKLPPGFLEVDHISGNTLDNRKDNLRVVPRGMNLLNKHFMSTNTSGTIGVCWDNSRYKWQAQIQLNGKTIRLGRFDKKEDAIEVRKRALAKIWEDFEKLPPIEYEPYEYIRETTVRSRTDGVYFHSGKNQWRARIQRNRISKEIGAFRTREEAVAARKNYMETNSILSRPIINHARKLELTLDDILKPELTLNDLTDI